MTESKLVNSHAKIPKSAVFARRYFRCKWSDFAPKDIFWTAIFSSFYFYEIISVSSYLHAKQRHFVQQFFL